MINEKKIHFGVEYPFKGNLVTFSVPFNSSGLKSKVAEMSQNVR